jgi:hypothetical protein
MDVVNERIQEIKLKLHADVYRSCCVAVSDMKKSCVDALDILDNLSIYEKIMGNNFAISKLIHPVKRTIENIVTPFCTQVSCSFSILYRHIRVLSSHLFLTLTGTTPEY